MKQDALLFFQMTYLNTIAMILFLLVFVSIILRVFRKSSKEHYRKLSRLPLESEEEGHEPKRETRK